MSMYKQFSTDAELEKSGVDLDYGDFKIKVARSGGKNTRFAKIFEEKMKPMRRAVQTDTLENARAEQLLREAFAEGVVLEWAVLVVANKDGTPKGNPPELAGHYRDKQGKEPEHSVFIQGIESPDGKILPYTTENVIETFKALPDLFADIREQAGKVGLFRREDQETDAKNS